MSHRFPGLLAHLQAREIAEVQRSSNREHVTIGVTGHRNIDVQSAALRAAISDGAMAWVADRYPGFRVSMMSGLAEGTDRLVAAMAHEALDANVIAVVPLPDDLYEDDFVSTALRKEYRELLASARRVVRAPLLARRSSLKQHGMARDRQYAWAGAFIARRADVLVAVWDGEPARGHGGTADVVSWFLSNATPRHLRMSAAPKLANHGGARWLIHINPHDLAKPRFVRVSPRSARGAGSIAEATIRVRPSEARSTRGARTKSGRARAQRSS